MVDDVNAPIGIAAYARHRGCSAAAVHKALAAGRLRGSVLKVNGRVMLRSAAAADREWEARTDRSRRPDYARTPPAPQQPELPTPPPGIAAAADDDGDLDVTPPASDPVLADYQREAMRERARKLKLENDAREGSLIDVDTAARQAFEFSRTVRENVLNVPARLAAEIAASRDAGRVHVLLTQALRDALEATAAALEEQGCPELAAATSPSAAEAIEHGVQTSALHDEKDRGHDV